MPGESAGMQTRTNGDKVVVKEEIEDEPPADFDLASYLVQVCIKEEAVETGQTLEDVNSSVSPHFPCHLCSTTYASVDGLNKHIADDHTQPQPVNVDVDVRHRCTICTAFFPKAVTLLLHLANYHSDSEQYLEMSGEAQIDDPSGSNNDFIDLDDEEEDDDASHQGSSGTSHAKGDSVSRPWICECCPARFFHKSDLKRHRDRFHPHKGPITDANWRGRDRPPQKATWSKQTERSWKCEVCSSLFVRKHGLVQHRKMMHSLESPVSDETHHCGGQINQPGEASNGQQKKIFPRFSHQRHAAQPMEGDSGFLPCPDCGYLFYGTRRLRRHQLTHGERKWKCEVCDHRFIRKTDLRRHRETRHCRTDELTVANRVDGQAVESQAPQKKRQLIDEESTPVARRVSGRTKESALQQKRQLIDEEPPVANRVSGRAKESAPQQKRQLIDEEPTPVASRVIGRATESGLRKATVQHSVIASTSGSQGSGTIRIYPSNNPIPSNLSTSSNTKVSLNLQNDGILFACTQCTGIFRLRSDLERHQISHGGGPRSWACDACQTIFMRKEDLEKHRQERHQLTDLVTEERHRVGGGSKAKEQPSAAAVSKAPKNQPHFSINQSPGIFMTCPICSSTYHSERALKKHIAADHKKATTTPNGTGSSSAPVPFARRGRHVCEFCGKNWISLATLEIHRRMHTGERPFQCAHCPHRCSNPSGLTSHMKRRHPETTEEEIQAAKRRWPCTACGVGYSSHYLLMLHQRRKHATAERELEPETKKAKVGEIKDEDEVEVIEVKMEPQEEEEVTSGGHQEAEEQPEVGLSEKQELRQLQEELNLNLGLLTDDEDTEEDDDVVFLQEGP